MMNSYIVNSYNVLRMEFTSLFGILIFILFYVSLKQAPAKHYLGKRYTQQSK